MGRKSIEASQIKATSSFVMNKPLVFAGAEEKRYTFSDGKNEGKEIEYYRLVAVFMDPESDNIFGNRVTILMNPKRDPGYAKVKSLKQNARGVLRIERTIVVYGDTSLQEETSDSYLDFVVDGEK